MPKNWDDNLFFKMNYFLAITNLADRSLYFFGEM